MAFGKEEVEKAARQAEVYFPARSPLAKEKWTSFRFENQLTIDLVVLEQIKKYTDEHILSYNLDKFFAGLKVALRPPNGLSPEEGEDANLRLQEFQHIKATFRLVLTKEMDLAKPFEYLQALVPSFDLCHFNSPHNLDPNDNIGKLLKRYERLSKYRFLPQAGDFAMRMIEDGNLDYKKTVHFFIAYVEYAIWKLNEIYTNEETKFGKEVVEQRSRTLIWSLESPNKILLESRGKQTGNTFIEPGLAARTNYIRHYVRYLARVDEVFQEILNSWNADNTTCVNSGLYGVRTCPKDELLGVDGTNKHIKRLAGSSDEYLRYKEPEYTLQHFRKWAPAQDTMKNFVDRCNTTVHQGEPDWEADTKTGSGFIHMFEHIQEKTSYTAIVKSQDSRTSHTTTSDVFLLTWRPTDSLKY